MENVDMISINNEPTEKEDQEEAKKPMTLDDQIRLTLGLLDSFEDKEDVSGTTLEENRKRIDEEKEKLRVSIEELARIEDELHDLDPLFEAQGLVTVSKDEPISLRDQNLFRNDLTTFAYRKMIQQGTIQPSRRKKMKGPSHSLSTSKIHLPEKQPHLTLDDYLMFLPKEEELKEGEGGKEKSRQEKDMDSCSRSMNRSSASSQDIISQYREDPFLSTPQLFQIDGKNVVNGKVEHSLSSSALPTFKHDLTRRKKLNVDNDRSLIQRLHSRKPVIKKHRKLKKPYNKGSTLVGTGLYHPLVDETVEERSDPSCPSLPPIVDAPTPLLLLSPPPSPPLSMSLSSSSMTKMKPPPALLSPLEEKPKLAMEGKKQKQKESTHPLGSQSMSSLKKRSTEENELLMAFRSDLASNQEDEQAMDKALLNLLTH
jgi:hypothetical protein